MTVQEFILASILCVVGSIMVIESKRPTMGAILIILTFVVAALGAVVRPSRAECPWGWDLRTGIQRDGSFACWPHPIGDPEWDGTWQREDRSVQASWVLEGRVYCTGRTPVVEDWNRVGCR